MDGITHRSMNRANEKELQFGNPGKASSKRMIEKRGQMKEKEELSRER